MLFYQYGYFFFALKLLEMVVDSKNSCVISSLSFCLVKLNFSLIITDDAKMFTSEIHDPCARTTGA